jgi:hypothetical protein
LPKNDEKWRVFVPVTDKLVIPDEVHKLIREGERTDYAPNPPYTLRTLLHVAKDTVGEDADPALRGPEDTTPEEAAIALKWLQETSELHGSDALIDCM